ncbi:MAG: HlyD family efflux transporter periplasmic adaptor subunit, partial [Spirochaetaceae bacterium]|nr:HlyD family efflux transporter periplasmic adaptor subunit [Spirochaetaceae bacterium]
FIAALNEADAGNLPVPPMNGDRQKLLASTMGVVGAWHALESAALDLEDHNVRAPFTGTITGRGLSIGSWVSPGQPLATLMDTRNMELRLSVSSDKLRDIAPGDPVRVSRSGDSRPGLGEVVRIEPVLSAGSQTAMIHVAMESDGDWLPGTFVTAEIKGRRIDSAFRVPRGALVDGRLPVYDDGKLALLPVNILAQDASDVLLAPDFPNGTLMVTTVLQNPIPGLSLGTEEDS